MSRVTLSDHSQTVLDQAEAKIQQLHRQQQQNTSVVAARPDYELVRTKQGLSARSRKGDDWRSLSIGAGVATVDRPHLFLRQDGSVWGISKDGAVMMKKAGARSPVRTNPDQIDLYGPAEGCDPVGLRGSTATEQLFRCADGRVFDWNVGAGSGVKLSSERMTRWETDLAALRVVIPGDDTPSQVWDVTGEGVVLERGGWTFDEVHQLYQNQSGLFAVASDGVRIFPGGQLDIADQRRPSWIDLQTSRLTTNLYMRENGSVCAAGPRNSCRAFTGRQPLGTNGAERVFDFDSRSPQAVRAIIRVQGSETVDQISRGRFTSDVAKAAPVMHPERKGDICAPSGIVGLAHVGTTESRLGLERSTGSCSTGQPLTVARSSRGACLTVDTVDPTGRVCMQPAEGRAITINLSKSREACVLANEHAVRITNKCDTTTARQIGAVRLGRHLFLLARDGVLRVNPYLLERSHLSAASPNSE